jgi:hypothetical protein
MLMLILDIAKEIVFFKEQASLLHKSIIGTYKFGKWFEISADTILSVVYIDAMDFITCSGVHAYIPC